MLKKKEHEDYLNWCLRGLTNIAYKEDKEYISGYDSTMVRGHTYSSFFIKNYFKDLINENGVKIVPDWVADEITPIALAFWFMDDGSLGHHPDQEDRADFATCAFDDNSMKVLQKGLKKFNINARIANTDGYNRLKINSIDADLFFNLIAPYVPPIMQYKLPERYRGGPGWLPNEETGVFKRHMVEQTITSIEKINKNYEKYDIETETHNFFANDILVHNSSAHLSWNNGKLGFFSGGEKYESFITLFDHEALETKFKELSWFTKCIIYGEVYGGRCQGMKDTYGDKLKFIAFDVLINDKEPPLWLSVPQAEKLVLDLGLEFVPYKKVSTDLTVLDAERDAPSEVAIRRGCGNDKMREGVVLRPLIELKKNNGERIIAKHKGDKFKETSTQRKVVDPSQLKVLEDADAIANEWVTINRLGHVLQKIGIPEELLEMKDTKKVIDAMFEDVAREAKGEIVLSREAIGAMGRKTAGLYRQYLNNKLKETQ
jgi:hypothetical protein